MERKNFLNVCIILIVSLISVADLFMHGGRPITFDGHIHMTTMAQFATALKDSEFPVTWSNGFANFGLPLPLFAHQLPAYIGAIFILAGSSTISAYNLTIAIAVILSAFFFYQFLRRHVSLDAALIGTIAFTLFPYRIINIFIRGALPEILASVFLPLLLIAIDLIFQDKDRRGYILFTVATCLLALTHPMMLIVFGIPTAAYLLFSIPSKKDLPALLMTVAAGALGLLMASYYLLPLILEMKYLFQGVQTGTNFHYDDFLGLKNFVDPRWYYYFTHPGPRGNFIKLGIPEGLTLITAVATCVMMLKKKQPEKKSLLVFWSGLSVLFIFFLLPISQFLYRIVPGFEQLQYPWRFLNNLQFSIPILAALLIQKFQLFEHPFHKKFLFLALVLFIAIRIPQLYGKNFAYYSDGHFFFTPTNLHTQNLNTIWSENSENYPVKRTQAAIIEGTGTLQADQLKNASRHYTVSAQTDVRLIDYTFYFPGWRVVSDGAEVPIEFQDINYRGLITYKLPAGDHQVSLIYGQTKVRKISLLLSIFSIAATLILIVLLLVNPRNWSKILTSNGQNVQ